MSGHRYELTFGSFITPAAADPDRAVALAVLAEQVGLDLVTFQDHPYQPSFLDTWTLLSFIAARTNRVRLSANVTNLPLRPPAVLARSLASLDLLSGGRAELGLGAGGFWDAMEAMGARRLTPGQSVQALEEAIDVVRQLWDVDTRGGARTDGEFYRLDGAKRGPKPAHAISIWLGAYKPRMLELTGRLADGWLPSMAFLQPGDLTAGNAAVDRAALEAGRAPEDIRRLLNVVGTFSATSRGPLHGPADQWAEELADLALTEGVSTFILATDDPDDLRRFAGEVAPAVRELVQEERRAPQPSPATPNKAPSRVGPLTVVPTPDEALRRSAASAWDESTRPTGPPAPPGRAYTADDQGGSRHLVEVHDVLRSELAQVRGLVDEVASGRTDAGAARSALNAMTLRQNAWTLGTYCQAYCGTLTTHHLVEDRSLFPQLRRAVPELTPVLDRLQQEHLVLHDVIEGVDRALVALVSVPDGMSQLRDSVDLLTDALLSHLAYEERELVEPIASAGIR